MFAKFDEIPSMILQDIKETKRYGHTFGRTDGQRESMIKNSDQVMFVIRDYHMTISLSPAVSTRDTIIKPEIFSLRADNGQRLILKGVTKIPCYNLFITYSIKFKS